MKTLIAYFSMKGQTTEDQWQYLLINLRPKRRKVRSCKKNEAVINRLVTYNL